MEIDECYGKQKYRRAWEVNEKYASWIEPCEDPSKALCNLCRQEMTAKTVVLDNHAKSIKHIKALNLLPPSIKIKSDLSVNSCASPNLSSTITAGGSETTLTAISGSEITLTARSDSLGFSENFSENLLESETAMAELKTCAWIAAKNISFLACDTLVPLNRQIYHDSEIVKNVRLNSEKCAEVIKQVLSVEHVETLADILRKRYFSFIVDDTTDITTTHSLCIIVRYYDENMLMINEGVYDLKEIYTTDNSKADAESIFRLIKESFEANNIPFSNVVAFCADTCNLMMGIHNSVAQKIKKENSNIIIVPCNAHIDHLSASKSIKTLPLDCEKLLSAIWNYINRSGQRLHNWNVLQKSLKLKKILNVKRAIFTRWLSVHRCIRRMMGHWDALKFYFEIEWQNHGNKQSFKKDSAKLENLKYIRDSLNNRRVKIYYMFLDFVLPYFLKTNALLQSIQPVFSKRKDLMRKLFLKLLSFFMKKSYIDCTKIPYIDPFNEENLLPLNKIKIGPKAWKALKKDISLNVEEKVEFFKNCLHFLQNACSVLRKKLPMTEDWQDLRCLLHPTNVINHKSMQKDKNINDLLNRFSFLAPDPEIRDLIKEECAFLHQYEFPDDIKYEKQIDIFWVKILHIRDAEQGYEAFKNVANFALNILTIPHSNASAERLWSLLYLEKSKLRNRLSFETLKALLLACQVIKDNGGILKFEPTENMLQRMKKLVYRPQKKKRISNDDDGVVMYNGVILQSDFIAHCQEEESSYKEYFPRHKKRGTDKNLTQTVDDPCAKKFQIRKTIQYYNSISTKFIPDQGNKQIDGLNREEGYAAEIIDLESYEIVDRYPYVEIRNVVQRLRRADRDTSILNACLKAMPPRRCPIIQNGNIVAMVKIYDCNFKMTQTCPFDSIIQIFLVESFENVQMATIIHNLALNSQYFKFIYKIFITGAIDISCYIERAKLLLMCSSFNRMRGEHNSAIEKTAKKTFVVNCEGNSGGLLSELVDNYSSAILESQSCSSGCGVVRRKLTKVSVDFAALTSDEFDHSIAKATSLGHSSSCSADCDGRREFRLVETGDIIFVHVASDNDSAVLLNQVPKLLQDPLDKSSVFFLIGFSNHEGNHFSSLYNRNGCWWYYSDVMLNEKQASISEIYKPDVLIFVRRNIVAH